MNILKEKLIIVGAGLSGLYLATLLEEKYDVTIIEARDRIGGRIFSIEGHDMGPSWIWSHHTAMLNLLSSMNIEIFPQYTKGYAIFDTLGKIEHFIPQPSTPSFRVDKTLSLLIDKLHKKLKYTKIHLNENVLSVLEKEDFIEISTDKNTLNAHKVIIAIPPRFCANLNFTPKLDSQILNKLSKTQTWMGNSSKCVIEFDTAFWKDQNLSGFVFSNQGPMVEIHDACTKEKAALFGFVSAMANEEQLKEDIKKQLQRIFKIDESKIGNIYLVAWRKEKFTATIEDAKPLREHPLYGINISLANEKILFSTTEFSNKEGGYLEGAVLKAQENANKHLII